ncbi:MAG: T9SS type A sorting domain-containing protein [Elusimicrobia bacterium]|nr:T9SS type A sorting domain-containing protein [Elusimicrobiota bacterium]
MNSFFIKLNNKKIIGIITAVFLISTLVSAATIQVGKASYTNVLQPDEAGPPITIYKTSNLKRPIPSNEWWTSLLSETFSATQFPHPLSFLCHETGLSIGLPAAPTIFGDDNKALLSDYVEDLTVEALVAGSTMKSTLTRADGYSDWTVTAYWSNDGSEYFKATYGHGLLFVYFEFSNNAQPVITFPGTHEVFDEYGGTGSGPVKTDHFGVKTNGKYYGIFAPANSTFTLTGSDIKIELPANERYLSIGIMTAQSDLAAWYQHAYAFVTDTKVSWDVDTEKSKVTTTFEVTTQTKRKNQATTLISLYPHQWKNLKNSISFMNQTFSTIRGTMKVASLNSFQVEHNFHGIIPFLPDRGSYRKSYLKSLVRLKRYSEIDGEDTYWQGKGWGKFAMLIPIADEIEDIESRDIMISRLRTQLIRWYTFTPGETSRYFCYNSQWGGLIGYNPIYTSENFTDQHFHYGYFIYASAILALYDQEFITDYGGIIDLMIRSFASPYRDDTMFPFLRTFDPYEGHSWASWEGKDQESSSEAMNAWAAIYLWGLITDNDTFRDLGIWGYVTEYTAIREYYYDIDDDKYGTEYPFNMASIIRGEKVSYATHYSTAARDVHAIQMLPLMPTMLYLGYDTEYARANYEAKVAFETQTGASYDDVKGSEHTFFKFRALYEPEAVLSAYLSHAGSLDDSMNTRAFTYHWICNFVNMGKVDTTVYANNPSFNVFDKDGTKTYVSYNSSNTKSTVWFYRREDDKLLGSLTVGPHSMRATNILDPALVIDSSVSNTFAGDFGTWDASLSIPSGTFSENVTVAMSSVTVTSSEDSTIKKTEINLEIAINKALQPAKEMVITINYSDADVSGLDESMLVFGRYDEASSSWIPLETNVYPEQNCLVSKINHFSKFAVFQKDSLSNLNSVIVYPNPYRPGSGGAFDRTGGIVFKNITQGAEIKIFNIAGEKVFSSGSIGSNNLYEWKAVNDSGSKVASGVYIYVITDPQGQIQKGKLAIIR